MSRFSVDLSADGARAHVSEAQGNQRKVLDYQVIPLPVGPDFAAALVHQGRPVDIRMWRLDARALLADAATQK